MHVSIGGERAIEQSLLKQKITVKYSGKIPEKFSLLLGGKLVKKGQAVPQNSTIELVNFIHQKGPYICKFTQTQ